MALAIVSGALFGADALLWKEGSTKNKWAPTLVRGAVELSFIALGFLFTRSWRDSGLTPTKTAAVAGSGVFTALGVVALGAALGDGADAGTSILLNSNTLSAVAFLGGILFL